MATRPTLHRAIEKTKNTASDYNDNFDMMMDFIDDSIDEAKGYVDDFMPEVTGQAGKVLTTDGTNTSWGVAVPIGTVEYYGGSVAPSGWLVCDGSAISRTTYAALFSAIGTSFGSGDGSTTFNLPNLINKFAEGHTTVGTVKNAGLPNITGTIHFAAGAGGPIGSDGAFTYGAYGTAFGSVQNPQANDLYFYLNASRSSGIYGASSTVQPPAVTMLPIIKY